jgi:hypothetical protein
VPYPDLHVLSLDFGKVTGWARFTVPRERFYPDFREELPASYKERPSVLDWKTGEIRGPESDQIWEVCRMVRAVQSLSWKVGPAVVPEGFDFGGPQRDPEVYSPVRMTAMLMFCEEQTALLDNGKVTVMPRSLPKETYTDARLRELGFYVAGPDHRRDATRIALMALRRARAKMAYRDRLWGPREYPGRTRVR